MQYLACSLISVDISHFLLKLTSCLLISLKCKFLKGLYSLIGNVEISENVVSPIIRCTVDISKH